MLSAGWLHAGALHILFNMMWVRQLGPAVAEMFGAARMIIIYTVAGVAGFLLSSFAGAYLPAIPLLHGAQFTIGASAPIFGLLGALVHYGRRGGSSDVRSEALRYAADVVRLRRDHAGCRQFRARRRLRRGLSRRDVARSAQAGAHGSFRRRGHLSAARPRSSILASILSVVLLMRKPVVLITGAGGEIGHGLIDRLAEMRRSARSSRSTSRRWIRRSRAKVDREITGSIVDKALLERVMAEFEVDLIFHLAALLSTRSEFTPVAAHEVNVEGTLHLLEFAQHEGESHGRPVVFIYPSSIAAYGLPDSRRPRRGRAGCARTITCIRPRCTAATSCTASCSARYYARHYKQLAADPASGKVDFRCVRFPGLISALTVPSGGTSDYAPEMIHAAAQGEPYACFVRPDTRIPFMAMPDGVDGAAEARRRAARAPAAHRLQRRAPSIRRPSEIRDVVVAAFPGARITWQTDVKRQAIVDSWPADVDDRAARGDWGFNPRLRFRPRLLRIFDSHDPDGATPGKLGMYHLHMPTLTVEGLAPVEVEAGKRLVLAIEQDAHVDVLHACGGNARCTTCRVEFIAGEPERMTAAEKHVLAARGADRRAPLLPDNVRPRHDRAGDQPAGRQRAPRSRSDALADDPAPARVAREALIRQS